MVKYDSIITLSQLINPDNSLKTETKERVDKAISLYNSQNYKNLIMSGGVCK